MSLAITLLSLAVSIGLFAGFNRMRRAMDSRAVQPVKFYDAFSSKTRVAYYDHETDRRG